MTMPDEFMNDPAVDAALDALQDALNAALTAHGAQIKTLVVLAHTTGTFNGSALLGCDCLNCTVEIATLFGDCIGATATVQQLPASVHRPAKAVH